MHSAGRYRPPPPLKGESPSPHHMTGKARSFSSSPRFSSRYSLSPAPTQPSRSANPYDEEAVGELDRDVYLVSARPPHPASPVSPSTRSPECTGVGYVSGHSPYTSARSHSRNASPVQYFSNCKYLVSETDAVTKVTTTFRCGELLGQGGFAKVFDFQDTKTFERYACKIIDKNKLKDPSKRQKLFAEIEIHRRLKHKNILEFIRYFEDDHYYYLLLERCCRQSLMDLHTQRGVFSLEEIQHIMTQLLVATEFMHSNLIIHRDLKLGNIMLDAHGNVKVGDFGFATQLSSMEDTKHTMCGTPNYIAPEVLKSAKCGSGYSFSVDIWSLGVILFTLAVGKPPFETKDVASTYDLIRQCKYTFPSHSLTFPAVPIPEGLKQMVSKMLCLKAEDRWSLMQLRQHNFLLYASQRIPQSLQDLDADISPISRSPIPSESIPRVPEMKTTEPGVAVLNYSHFSKYGWCYQVRQHDGCNLFGVTLNDRTKILHDEETDALWYFNREKRDQRIVDVPYFFKDIPSALIMAESSAGCAMSLAKKISILRFLKNFQSRYGADGKDGEAMIVPTASSFVPVSSQQTIVSVNPVYVKDFEGVDFESPPQCLARSCRIRTSLQSYQCALEVMCCPVEHCVSLTGYGACIAPWFIDCISCDGEQYLLTFASNLNQRSISVRVFLKDIKHSNNHGMQFCAGPLKIPTWVCNWLIQLTG